MKERGGVSVKHLYDYSVPSLNIFLEKVVYQLLIFNC